MSRLLTGSSLVVALAASAGVVFSAVQLRQANEAIERLEGRLAGLEKTAVLSSGYVPSPKSGSEGAGGTDAPSSDRPIETLGDTIKEVQRLRDEMEAVRASAGHATADPGAPGAAGSGPAPSGEEAMRKVVEDVLAKREQERIEADKKRAQEWAKARLERTVTELTERLALSAQQRDQVSQILTGSSDKQMEIWTNRKEGENPWPKVQELRKETDAQVKQYLTAEQQTKYDEYMRSYWGPPRGGMAIEGTNTGGERVQPR